MTEQQQMERKHVFAINGAPEFLDIVRELLQEEDFNVTTSNFVPESFDMISALKPDLIIIDLAIGQEAGWELLERLQAEAITHEIPVLVTSTDQRLLERAQANEARYGGNRYIAKPMNLDDLLEAVHQMIGLA